MLLRAILLLVLLCLVAYRLTMARAVRRARRAGDTALERRLLTHGFRLYRYGLVAVAAFLLLLSLLVWSGSH